MSIDWIEDFPEESDELPWLKDFVRQLGNYDYPQPVVSCFLGSKGILVTTAEWKGFAFKRSRVYDYLYEALMYIKETVETQHTIVACGNEAGKLVLGLDRSTGKTVWSVEETAFHQHAGHDNYQTRFRARADKNPLLPNPSPQSRSEPEINQSPPSKGKKPKSAPQEPQEGA